MIGVHSYKQNEISNEIFSIIEAQAYKSNKSRL